MALEDAVVLGKLLNLSPSTAFLKLAEDQIKRTFRLHQETLFSGYIYHLRSPLAPARNLILKALSPLKTQERLSWIYDNRR